MVKHFCDLCGHELKVDDYVELRFPMGDLMGIVTIKKGIMLGKVGQSVVGDVCWECVNGLIRLNQEVGSE